MRKFLLSMMFAALTTVCAMAETVTFTFTGDSAYGMTLLQNGDTDYNPDPFVCSADGVTITLNGKTRWWAANSGHELRFYKGSNMVITGPAGQNITKVVLTASAPNNFSASGYAGGTWVGNAASVQIDCTVTSGNTPVKTIAVTYGESGGDEPQPALYGEYVKATTMTEGYYVIYAENIIAAPLDATKNYGYINTSSATFNGDALVALKTDAFVFKAVDGGYTIQDCTTDRYYYMTGSYNSFNLSSERTDGDTWTVVINADGTASITNVLMGKTLMFSTTYNSFGAYPESADDRVLPTLYKFSKDAGTPDTPPTPEYTVVDHLNALPTMANNEKFKMEVDLTVVYANGAYVYVFDGSTYGLIYKYDLGLNAGDVIAKGWTGKVSIYSKLVEMVPDETLVAASTGATVPEPMDVEADEVSMFVVAYNQSAYLRLMGVTFDNATPAADAASAERTYTGKMGDTEVTFYQRFGLESMPAGTYNVTGFVAVYNDLVQIYPTSIVDPSGITDITTDGSAPVYYNLQGIKVAQPADGQIYIRVTGGHATKIIK